MTTPANACLSGGDDGLLSHQSADEKNLVGGQAVRLPGALRHQSHDNGNAIGIAAGSVAKPVTADCGDSRLNLACSL